MCVCKESHKHKSSIFQFTITVAELDKDLLEDEHLGRNMKNANEEKTLSGSGEKKRCSRPRKRIYMRDTGIKTHGSCAAKDS